MEKYQRNRENLKNIQTEFNRQKIAADMFQILPGALYRYNSVSEYMLDDLQEDSVSLTQPKNFNDALDSLFQVHNERTILEEHRLNSDIAKKAGYKWPQTEEEFISAFNRVNESYLQFARESSLVKSFSEEHDNEMLWSLYGNNNKGICLEYNTNMSLFDHAYPVIYGTKELLLNKLMDIETDRSIVQAIIMSSIYKSQKFENEKEWRVIFPELSPAKKNEFIKFKIGIPSKIIFGSRFFELDDRWEREKIDKYITLFDILKEKKIPMAQAKYNLREIEIKHFDGVILNDYFKSYKTYDISQYDLFEVIEKILSQ